MADIAKLNEAMQSLERSKSAFEDMMKFAQSMQELENTNRTETRFRLKKESGKIIQKALTKRNKKAVNKVYMKDIAAKMGIAHKTLSQQVNGISTMDGAKIGFLLIESGVKMEEIVDKVIFEMPFNLVASQVKQGIGFKPSDNDMLQALKN